MHFTYLFLIIFVTIPSYINLYLLKKELLTHRLETANIIANLTNEIKILKLKNSLAVDNQADTFFKEISQNPDTFFIIGTLSILIVWIFAMTFSLQNNAQNIENLTARQDSFESSIENVAETIKSSTLSQKNILYQILESVSAQETTTKSFSQMHQIHDIMQNLPDVSGGGF